MGPIRDFIAKLFATLTIACVITIVCVAGVGVLLPQSLHITERLVCPDGTEGVSGQSQWSYGSGHGGTRVHYSCRDSSGATYERTNEALAALTVLGLLPALVLSGGFYFGVRRGKREKFGSYLGLALILSLPIAFGVYWLLATR